MGLEGFYRGFIGVLEGLIFINATGLRGISAHTEKNFFKNFSGKKYAHNVSYRIPSNRAEQL